MQGQAQVYNGKEFVLQNLPWTHPADLQLQGCPVHQLLLSSTPVSCNNISIRRCCQSQSGPLAPPTYRQVSYTAAESLAVHLGPGSNNLSSRCTLKINKKGVLFSAGKTIIFT